jgi:integrase
MSSMVKLPVGPWRAIVNLGYRNRRAKRRSEEMSRRGNGEGSIYQMSDGRWRAAISLGYGDGKPIRKIFTAKTRKEVQDALIAALRERQLGILVPPDKQTVAQFLRWWLEQVVKPTARPKTMKFYEFVSRVHLVPGLGRLPLQRLTPQHVQSFLNERLIKPSVRTQRPLSVRSVRHIHRTLCTALNSAVKYGNISRNVAARVDPPRAPKPDIRYFTVEQAREFLSAAKGDRLYALFATVLSLGLRLGEGLGVAWPDLDLDTGRFNIRQALQRIDEKLYPERAGLQLVEPKGGYSNRVVTLPAVAISALRYHQAHQEQERQWAGTRWLGNQWNLVFTTTLGTPLDERGVLRRFQKILTLAGLPKLRIHDLRHSAVAILIAQGVNIKAISELLGHSSVAFTLQVYGHLLEETKRETAIKMDAALAPVATSIATKVDSARAN